MGDPLQRVTKFGSHSIGLEWEWRRTDRQEPSTYLQRPVILGWR